MVQGSAKRLVLFLNYQGLLGSKSEMADRVLHVWLLLCNAQPQACFVYSVKLTETMWSSLHQAAAVLCIRRQRAVCWQDKVGKS